MKKGIITSTKEGKESFWFNCPGCKSWHHIVFKRNKDDVGPVWKFNKDLEKPTVSPSILVTWDTPKKKHRCHSYVKKGKIEFLKDCSHKLAGQTVELKEWKDDWNL